MAYQNGVRVNAIDIDGSGLRAVPAACQNCHGGVHLDANTIAAHVAQHNVCASLKRARHDVGVARRVFKRSLPPRRDAELTRPPSSTEDARWSMARAARCGDAWRAQRLMRIARYSPARSAFVIN